MHGLHNQLEKVNHKPGTDSGVPRSDSGHSVHGAETPIGQVEKDPCGVTQTHKGTDFLCLFLSTPAGEDECNNSCHSSSSSILQTPADESYPGIGRGLSILQDTGHPFPKGKRRTDVVGEPHVEMKWEITCKTEIDIVIDSDASLMGWGATSSQQRTGGPWSAKESKMHINCLELLAATFAVKTFVKKLTQVSVLLRIDNTTAVAYINNMEGKVSAELVALARSLWMWCLEKNIHITAQYLPGVQNTIADAESQTIVDRFDWKLNPNLYRRIDHLFGPIEVD